MKHLFIIVVVCTLFTTVYAQTISPVQTGEFCPNTEYTFTVSIPKPYQSMIGINSASVTQTPASPVGSTFTFRGKFGDANQKQSFRINYADGSSFDFEFKKIKSLFYSVISLANPPCNVIKPIQVQPLLFPICQASSATISFPNIQWLTAFENPELCFGSVTDYEYLLPSGWKLGTTTSNGSTWLPANNNVTVTSDLSTGDGATIKIRASNKTCGTGLAANGPVATVLISRPKPALTFTGGSTVCTSQNFQANNVPAWVTNYAWQVTPTTIFGNANPNANPTTVTKLFDGEGDIQLTISSPACSLSFLYNTQEITGRPKLVAGAPIVQSTQPLSIYNNPGDENEVCRNVETVFDFTTGDNSTANWSYISHSGNPQPSWSLAYPDDLYLYFFKPTQNTLLLKLDVTNSCGTVSYNFGFKAVDCAGLKAAVKKNAFKISPNPANNIINITQDATTYNLITEITVADFNNNMVSSKKYTNVKTAQLSIAALKAGTYFVTVVYGKFRETQKILKQ